MYVPGSTLFCTRFQSTHPRRVRRSIIFVLLQANYFNPRTHEGCDSVNFTIKSASSYFNPRTHEGCDQKIVFRGLDDPIFQSTHPRRVRHKNWDAVQASLTISIHAPTKGATSAAGILPSALRISIHAPTKGATT